MAFFDAQTKFFQKLMAGINPPGLNTQYSVLEKVSQIHHHQSSTSIETFQVEGAIKCN